MAPEEGGMEVGGICKGVQTKEGDINLYKLHK